MPKEKRPCEGLPRVCPGQCNPRNRRQIPSPHQETQSPCKLHQSTHRHEIVPEYHEQNIVSHNVHYNPEFALFSQKTQTELQPRPITPILSEDERQIIDTIARRVQQRRRRRNRGRSYVLRRIVAFVMFFFLHGCIAALAKDYHHYQTFLATQFCGLITILFWDETE